MAKKIKEDDAIEVKDKKDMSTKDQKDIKNVPIDESFTAKDVDVTNPDDKAFQNAVKEFGIKVSDKKAKGPSGHPTMTFASADKKKLLAFLDRIGYDDAEYMLETEDDDKKGAVVIATEDDDADDKKVVVKEKKSIKESTDHIVGIVSSGKLHLLEDGIMGVIQSKLVEKLDAAKAQIKAKAMFKGA